MSNLLAALLAIGATALLVLVMMVTYRPPQKGDNQGPITQTPTIIVREGRMVPKVVNVNSQELVQLVIINEAREPREIVLDRLDANGKKVEELRRTTIEPGLSQNMTLRLVPGQYALYCANKEGVHECRKQGEEMRIIAH